MNTGDIIETERLILRPSNNTRDNDDFLHMLQTDGDFEQYCGLKLNERSLENFVDYFEHEDMALYSIFLKEAPDVFVGYAGCGYYEYNERYEVDFYVGRQFRNAGICTEALRCVIDQLFEKGLSIDGKIIKLDKIFAETLRSNEPAKRVLEKLGFERWLPKDGSILLAKMVVVSDEDDDIAMLSTEEFVLEKIGTGK